MASLPGWHEKAVARDHDRGEFDCGVPDLNEYLARYARQNHDLHYVTTFVAVPDDNPRRVLGYYSLCNAHVEFTNLPESLVHGLPRYPVPAVRLARLACDLSCQGLGLGRQLLLCAAKRAIAVSELSGAVILLVDAKNEQAAAWYEKNDAICLLDDALRLVLPLASVRAALESSG
ncbi:MAG TPA: GNAT family N-acetyltransferase [Alphaproteobacteria bacterium]